MTYVTSSHILSVVQLDEAKPLQMLPTDDGKNRRWIPLDEGWLSVHAGGDGFRMSVHADVC